MAIEGLSIKQCRAIAELMVTRKIEDAASNSGVGFRTLTRWLTLPIFKQGIKEAQTDMLSGATMRMVSQIDGALDTIVSIMRTGDSDTVRLRAADMLIGRLIEFRNITDIEERLTKLESEVQNGNKITN